MKHKEFLKAALTRAIRQICQTAVSLIGPAMAAGTINWLAVGSASVLAGMTSVLVSIATGLPELNGERNKFWTSSAIRAVRTVCNTAVGVIGSAAMLGEVDWKNLAFVSVVSGVLSILTAVATGLPEVGENG